MILEPAEIFADLGVSSTTVSRGDLKDVVLGFQLIIPGEQRTVDPSLVATSKQVMKFAGYYLDIDSSMFSWIFFMLAVQGYTSSHSDLKQEKLEGTTIHQGTASVSSMVNKISQYLLDTFQVSEILDLKELSATVEATFTNLKTSTESGFADFSSSTSSSNSSYEYRIAFSFPHKYDSSKFHCLVATIILRASIKHESSWWGLVSSTEKDFSAAITGMQLEVTKGFIAPPRS